MKIHLPIIISKTCEDPVNDYRVVADEIAVVLLKGKITDVIANSHKKQGVTWK
jgi:hypothetical protein